MFESLDIASPVSSQTHVDWSGVCWGLWCAESVGSGITGWCPSPASFLGQGSRDQRFPPGSFLAASKAQPGSMKPQVLVLLCCCFSSSNWVRGATSAGISLHLASFFGWGRCAPPDPPFLCILLFLIDRIRVLHVIGQKTKVEKGA